jgi:hypothetical protein
LSLAGTRQREALRHKGSELTTRSPAQRKKMLARAVANRVREGWRIESQADHEAVIVRGQRPNHALHLILTLLTVGLWAIVWVAVSWLGGEERGVLEIDEYGVADIRR